MKRSTKTAALLMAVVCLIGTIVFTAVPGMADTATPRVTYKIVSNSSTPTIARGSSFEADFTFYDNNNPSPDKVKITVTSPNSSISGLPRQALIPTNVSDGIGSSSETDSSYGSYLLNIPESNLKYVGTGPAVLKFKIQYDNTTYYVQKTITECQPSSSSSQAGRSDLLLQSYQLNRTGIKEGEKFQLTLNIKNTGTLPNSHVTAVLDGLSADEITVDGQLDTRTIDTLAAGESATVSYPMICNPKMASKNYIVKLQLSSDEAPTPVASNVFVPVTGTKSATESGSDSPNASKPLIIIENYDYGGQPTMGGKQFNLTMRFRNTSVATQIENLKITVSSVAGTDDKSAAGAFTPAKSSNTFYTAKVGPGTAFTEQIALIPKADATPNSYGVEIACKYEAVLDGKRESIESQETIAIPLSQPDRFQVNEAEVPPQMFVGEPGQLNIPYANKGKSKIFNLSVQLKGNFTTGESSTYVGNVDSGAGDSFQASLTPKGEGPLTGSAVFTYEDANGSTKSFTRDFSCEVVAAQDPGSQPDSEPVAPNEQGGHSFPWYYWAAGAAVLIAALVIVRRLLRKHKMKKLARLEESDSYDDPPSNGGIAS